MVFLAFGTVLDARKVDVKLSQRRIAQCEAILFQPGAPLIVRVDWPVTGSGVQVGKVEAG